MYEPDTQLPRMIALLLLLIPLTLLMSADPSRPAPTPAPAPTPSMCMGYYLEEITPLKNGAVAARVNGRPRMLFPLSGADPVPLRTGCYSVEAIDAGYTLGN